MSFIIVFFPRRRREFAAVGGRTEQQNGKQEMGVCSGMGELDNKQFTFPQKTPFSSYIFVVVQFSLPHHIPFRSSSLLVVQCSLLQQTPFVQFSFKHTIAPFSAFLLNHLSITFSYSPFFV
jgi:hypothetical protein